MVIARLGYVGMVVTTLLVELLGTTTVLIRLAPCVAGADLLSFFTADPEFVPQLASLVRAEPGAPPVPLDVQASPGSAQPQPPGWGLC